MANWPIAPGSRMLDVGCGAGQAAIPAEGLTEDEAMIRTHDQPCWAELVDARTLPVEISLALL